MRMRNVSALKLLSAECECEALQLLMRMRMRMRMRSAAVAADTARTRSRVLQCESAELGMEARPLLIVLARDEK
jgi:hypothetical protein